MKPWLLAIFLKPFLVYVYVAAIVLPLWAAKRFMRRGRLQALLMYRFPQTRGVAVLMLVLGFAVIAVPLTVVYWLGLS